MILGIYESCTEFCIIVIALELYAPDVNTYAMLAIIESQKLPWQRQHKAINGAARRPDQTQS